MIPLVVGVLLIAACGLWVLASAILPAWLISGLWVAALIIVMLPLILSLVDRATSRKRSR
jgi:Flp pilus assembly protein protease CpaA